MNNTRKDDLDILDQSRGAVQSEEARLHREALLESVYQQSKDSFLEAKRRELTQWIIRGLSNAPENGIPTHEQKKNMAESEVNIQRIEQQIKEYTQSDHFKASIASKVAKINETEAELLMKG